MVFEYIGSILESKNAAQITRIFFLSGEIFIKSPQNHDKKESSLLSDCSAFWL